MKNNKIGYGSWESPITAEMVASKVTGLSSIKIDGRDVYWVEMRPGEGGRYVLVKYGKDGGTKDIVEAPYNVRTLVHEYGGGAYLVKDGTIIFSNFEDQKLYRKTEEGKPSPLTKEREMRYADGVIDSYRNRVICIREDHTVSQNEPENAIVSIDLDNYKSDKVLTSGYDFYSSPSLCPDGDKLAWLSWNHPRMPWDGTELWLSELDERGELINPRNIAGGEEVSIFQPQWSPKGTLHFVSDEDGWWNLYSYKQAELQQITNMEAEFGKPQWGFGMSTYDFLGNGRIVCSYCREANWELAITDSNRKFHSLDIPFTGINYLKATKDKVYFVGGSPKEPSSLVEFDTVNDSYKVIKRSMEIEVDSGYLSEPESIKFPSRHDSYSHGFYYPPKNSDFSAPPDELPPLIVISHGGPTSSTSTTLDLGVQYWTSRGFGVLDVNYGGSTGYGRNYRQRLAGKWGIVDVDDCVDGAKYLVAEKLADPHRLIIRGGSAGGYTTLSALTFSDTFKAGASYYGVSDLEALLRETHKFESKYLHQLLGPYPEKADIYKERSPINHADDISCPVIFLQGLEDKVVPPSQAQSMVKSLKEKGIPVAYLPFEGEQHGFRIGENRKRALEAELYFYSKVFDFEIADTIEPIDIENNLTY